MDIIAAFCWDGSKDKSISYMIIDDEYQTRCAPVIRKLASHDARAFEREVQKVIEKFFNEIKEIQNGAKSTKVKIEYKVVGHASPVSQFHTQMHKPSDRTEYVRVCFLKKLKSINDNNIKLASQFRKKLAKSALTDFKRELKSLNVVNGQKGNAFEYHLWSLALHATKKTYEVKLRKLKKALIQRTAVPKDKTKRRVA